MQREFPRSAEEEWQKWVASTSVPVDYTPTPGISFLEASEAYLLSPNRTNNDMDSIDITNEPILPNEILKEEDTMNSPMISMNGISGDVKSEVADKESILYENSLNDGQELTDHSDQINVDPPDGNSIGDETMDDLIEDNSNPPVENSRKRRSAKSKVVHYAESSGEEEEKDGEYEKMEKGGEESDCNPPVKKAKTAKKTFKIGISNGSKREMECPECKTFRSSCVRSVHRKSPTQAGILFLCDCGYKSASKHHAQDRKYQIFNFTIIHEKKFRTKCILCEIRPSTMIGYVQHMKKKHSSTLTKSGYHLKCERGCNVDSDRSAREH